MFLTFFSGFWNLECLRFLCFAGVVFVGYDIPDGLPEGLGLVFVVVVSSYFDLPVVFVQVLFYNWCSPSDFSSS